MLYGLNMVLTTINSVVCCCNGYPLLDIPQRATLFYWENWMCRVHRWLHGDCRQCTQTGPSLHDSRYAGFCHCAWIPSICWNNYSCLHWHCDLRWTKMGKSKHAGVSERLQPNRRIKCSVHSRNWCSDYCSSTRNSPIQSMVYIFYHCFCRHHATSGNRVFECKCACNRLYYY